MQVMALSDTDEDLREPLREKRRKHPLQVHRAYKGHVECPVRGYVDMEFCFYCKFLEVLDMDRKVPIVACRRSRDDVTREELVAYERLSILELAEILGNVSEACREHGISRRQFYDYKHRYEKYGLEGLKERRRSRRRRRINTFLRSL
nr:helix-turn-helix domain-containing protein [Alicyclobacillus sp. SO9]